MFGRKNTRKRKSPSKSPPGSFYESLYEPVSKPSFQSPSERASKSPSKHASQIVAYSPNTNAKTQRANKRFARSIRKYLSDKKTNVYLKQVCTDSGTCMAFGKELDKIREYFGGFTRFEYLHHKKRIGEKSNSGFIIEVAYERKDYLAYAILKSALKSTSDNLTYEYYIGVHFVNGLCKRFPCFLETYGLYYYKTHKSWENAQNKYKLSEFDLRRDLTFEPTINFKKACQKSMYIAILIQHIDKPITLETLFMYAIKNNVSELLIFDFVYILIQVYYPLACLQNVFTHYDLHLNNVLIYKLPKDKCVEYRFVDDKTNRPITFRTQYLVKIIDYGRSFFEKNKHELNSRALYRKLCRYPECNRMGRDDQIYECGEGYGFGTFSDSDFTHIHTKQRNKSHDLRLLHDLVYEWVKYEQDDGVIIKFRRRDPKFETLIKSASSFSKVCDDLIFEQQYGTPELESDLSDDGIRNVGDLYKRLLAIINEPEYTSWNRDTYGKMECMSTFQINGQDQMIVT